MEYHNMTDGEIAERIAKIIGLNTASQGGKAVLHVKNGIWTLFDPCNNPADAWPIIVNNGISLECIVVNRHEKTWRAQFKTAYVKHRVNHKNRLRAAMIVFLMMQESKNAS